MEKDIKIDKEEVRETKPTDGIDNIIDSVSDDKPKEKDDQLPLFEMRKLSFLDSSIKAPKRDKYPKIKEDMTKIRNEEKIKQLDKMHHANKIRRKRELNDSMVERKNCIVINITITTMVIVFILASIATSYLTYVITKLSVINQYHFNISNIEDKIVSKYEALYKTALQGGKDSNDLYLKTKEKLHSANSSVEYYKNAYVNAINTKVNDYSYVLKLNKNVTQDDIDSAEVIMNDNKISPHILFSIIASNEHLDGDGLLKLSDDKINSIKERHSDITEETTDSSILAYHVCDMLKKYNGDIKSSLKSYYDVPGKYASDEFINSVEKILIDNTSMNLNDYMLALDI